MSKAEKFISEHTRNCSNLMQVPTLDDKGNIVPEAHPWLTPDQALRAVEIAREEVIKKVCEFLSNDLCCYIKAQHFTIENQRLENALKQAMKMNEAVNAALEAYPIESDETDDDLYIRRNAYVKGYHQAEEDLELTWEDLATIEKLCDDFVKQNQTPMSEEEFYKEILKRFKRKKEIS